VKVNATGDNPDDLVRRVRSEVSSWTPERGPSWPDLARRARRRPLRLLGVYAMASAALMTIVLVAFLAMALLHVGGSLVGEPSVSHFQGAPAEVPPATP
jgi:hypothetical protein